ncbi:uncharacterized protein MONBRDRAFT_23105 [Monosiga brevicollis MX1]|uniref:Fibronectin type-III domain-containing protein n=1 Tax=Monosiga brevicollis TaxID=81824 RepID=A9UR73_MONBE|nr:uncharacterized protein MONBRDRAFT_23105 [Monosiga brevicollis MX1]EDQ92195.1 predicted protein [Monosiga brevicollis MX1]|eukprot:XP_001743481.1 hypothetical protein [Monosiga brevicollis MX1]
MPFKIRMQAPAAAGGMPGPQPAPPVNRRTSSGKVFSELLTPSQIQLKLASEATAPPDPPPAPIVQVTANAALLCWKPLRQGVGRIVLQAMPVKKAGAKANFKKFELGGKVGGCRTVLVSGCDRISSAVISGLEENRWYVFRLVVSNNYGAVEGAPSVARATGDLIKEEIKGSIRRKDRRPRRSTPDITDSRAVLAEAAEQQGKDVRAERRRSGQALDASQDAQDPNPSQAASHVSSKFEDAGSDEVLTLDHAIERGDQLPIVEDHDAPGTATQTSGQAKAQEALVEKASIDDPRDEGPEVGAAVREFTTERLAVATNRNTPISSEEANSESTTHALSLAAPIATRAASSGAPETNKKSTKSRLGAGIDTSFIDAPSKIEEQEERRRQATQMFKRENADEPERSRIFQALNPQPLWYQSRREKEELEDEEDGAHRVHVRGTGLGALDEEDISYARPIQSDQEDDGQEAESEDEDEDETGYDTDNAPDFGELQSELDELRRRRAEKEQQRRRRMKEEHERKRLQEQAQREIELEAIRAKEQEREKAEAITDADVEAAQARAAETAKYMTFAWD